MNNIIALSLVFSVSFTHSAVLSNTSVTHDNDKRQYDSGEVSSRAAPSLLYSWVSEMRSSDGWSLGFPGLSLHLDEVNTDRVTKSLLERKALRVDFNGIGMRVAKAVGKEELDVGFYADGGEGRQKDKQGSEYLLHAMFGFNIAGLVAFTLAAFGVLVLKSLAVAKLALALAAYMMVKKLFGGSHGGHLMRQSYELMDSHPSDLQPSYIDYTPAYGAYGYPPSGAAVSGPAVGGGNAYLAYSSYAPTAAQGDPSVDTSNVAYAIAEPPVGAAGETQRPANLVAAPGGAQGQVLGSQHLSQQQQLQRRRDLRRKLHLKKPQHVTVNKYTKVY